MKGGVGVITRDEKRMKQKQPVGCCLHHSRLPCLFLSDVANAGLHLSPSSSGCLASSLPPFHPVRVFPFMCVISVYPSALFSMLSHLQFAPHLCPPTLSDPFLFQQFFIGPTVCQSLCVPGVGNTTVRQDAEHDPVFGAMGEGAWRV